MTNNNRGVSGTTSPVRRCQQAGLNQIFYCSALWCELSWGWKHDGITATSVNCLLSTERSRVRWHSWGLIFSTNSPTHTHTHTHRDTQYAEVKHIRLNFILTSHRRKAFTKTGHLKPFGIRLIRFVFLFVVEEAWSKRYFTNLCQLERRGGRVWRMLPINLSRFSELYIRHGNQNKKIMNNEKCWSQMRQNSRFELY